MLIGLSDGEVKNSQFFKSTIDSQFVGLYKHFTLPKSTFASLNIVAGKEKYKNSRDLTDNEVGLEVARSNVDNLFITPSAAIENRIKFYNGKLQIRPKASLSYTNSSFDKATETGSTNSNMAFKARDAKVLNSRAGVSTYLTLARNYQVNFGAGLDSRKISEDKVNATVDDTSFAFDNGNKAKVNGRYYNVGFDVVNIKDLTLSALYEKRTASNSEDQSFISATGVYRF